MDEREACYAIIQALRDKPEVPDWRVLLFLSQVATAEDWDIGKAMQRKYGFDLIPPVSEYEQGMGVWSKILRGLTRTLPERNEE